MSDPKYKLHHQVLAKYKYISLAACICLLTSFALFLLVALSIPIVKAVYLFVFKFNPDPSQPPTSVATDLRFGVWGFCASSVLNLPTIFTNNGDCTASRLGYVIAPDLLELTGHPELASAVLEGLTVLLVLHPVCAGLSFLCAFTSLFLVSQSMTIISLFLSIVTGLISSVVLAADLAIEIVAKMKVRELTAGTVDVGWGNGVWMVLVATALTWVSAILLSGVACRCCGRRFTGHHHHHHHDHQPSQPYNF